MIRKIIRIGELVTVDNFSTYRNGNPIGDRRFIWVDTVSKQWGFADGNGKPEELSDPKLDIGNYKVGDCVKFKIRYHASFFIKLLIRLLCRIGLYTSLFRMQDWRGSNRYGIPDQPGRR